MTVTSAPLVSTPAQTPEPRRISKTTRLWMWAFLPAFVAHDGEEVGYIVKQGGFKEFGQWQTVAQCLAGILFEFTVGWLLVLFATRAGRAGWAMRIYTAFLAGWTLHGVLHLVEGATGHGYVFGSVTALPFAVVYGALTLARVYGDGVVERKWFALALFPGSVLTLSLILTAHGYGSLME